MDPLQKIIPGPSPAASFREFFKLEAAGGFMLFGAAVLAMALKNSPVADIYQQLLMMPVQMRAGTLDLHKPLVLWVNDGLMAVFFFMVALEIKREMLIGHLANPRTLVLPGMAAIGGMLVPALLYVALNFGDSDAMHGWAIPTTTDIAFALGVLALAGSRVPPAVKMFLLTLAVLDDLAAIVIIAVFYSGELSVLSLNLAAAFAILLATLNLAGVKRLAPYILTGIALWVCVLKSGVHATLAGVVLGFAIPMGDRTDEHKSPLRSVIHDLHPWVAFGILPLFAFFNAGIDFSDFDMARLLHPVPVGIALGLLIGKPVGVLTFAWLTLKFRLASLPEGSTWQMLVGVAFLCGIGFTMSIFLGGLAFQEGGSGYARADRIGIVAGSLIAGIAGYLILRRALDRADAARLETAPEPAPEPEAVSEPGSEPELESEPGPGTV